MREKYDWEEIYEGAVLETDDRKLPTRLQAAKSVVGSRLQKLQGGHTGTIEERKATYRALQHLDLLERELKTRTHEADSSTA